MMKFAISTYFIFLLIPLSSQQFIVEGGPVLLPHMTIVERDNLTAQEGMLIYNSSTKSLQGYAQGTIESDTLSGGFSSSLLEELIAFTPVDALLLESIELNVTSCDIMSSHIDLLSNQPCNGGTILGSSMNNCGFGWTLYEFSPALILAADATYYIQSVGANPIEAILGSSVPGLSILEFDGDNTCDLTTEINYAIRINYKGWHDLH